MHMQIYAEVEKLRKIVDSSNGNAIHIQLAVVNKNNNNLRKYLIKQQTEAATGYLFSTVYSRNVNHINYIILILISIMILSTEYLNYCSFLLQVSIKYIIWIHQNESESD